MKKIIAVAICLIVALGSLQAQSYTGYFYNSYEGIAGATVNPASIAGGVYKLDVNIFSISGSLGTNAYDVRRSTLFRFSRSGWREGDQYSKINNGDDKNAWGNLDILGPSVMVAITPKHSVGLTSRFRFLTNARNLSNDVFQLFGPSKPNAIFGSTFRQDNLRVDAHAFTDFGLTYGGVVFENDNHKLKVGATAKWVLGLGAGLVYADNVNVNLQDRNTITSLTGNAGIAYSTGIDRLIKGDLNGSLYDYIDARGFGLDLGVVYEWTSAANRARVEEGGQWFTPTSYKLRVAASVTDIGRLKYDVSGNSGTYMMNFVNVPTNTLNLNDRSLNEFINDLRSGGYIGLSTAKELKPNLPTLLRANIDWQAWKRLYVNLDGALNLVGSNTVGARYLSGLALTPRYESCCFSVYSPVSYNEQGEFGWGIGFNVGVFFVGSSTILSNALSSNVSSADFHAGVHIPIGRAKKPKSKPIEQPPVYIPEPEPEPIVPQVDTIIKIKEVVVYVEPEVEPGVDESIVREVDLLSNSIYFVTGSDWLLIESREPLRKIAAILKANPEVNAVVEGHADSVGTDVVNDVLSKQRARRVANALIENGVAEQRIFTEGFGSHDPVAANITRAGKARNRRVEIRLYLNNQ